MYDPNNYIFQQKRNSNDRFFFDPFERSLQASGKCTGGTGGALAVARSSAARNPSSSHVEFLTNQQD